MVTKQRADSGSNQRGWRLGAPTAQMKQFREMYDLRVTGEERVDNVNCYVLEGIFQDAYLQKNPQAEMMKTAMNRIKMYIGKKDMFPHKVVRFSTQGRETMSMKLTNIKMNIKIDESLFKYTPPANARITDETGE